MFLESSPIETAETDELHVVMAVWAERDPQRTLRTSLDIFVDGFFASPMAADAMIHGRLLSGQVRGLSLCCVATRNTALCGRVIQLIVVKGGVSLDDRCARRFPWSAATDDSAYPKTGEAIPRRAAEPRWVQGDMQMHRADDTGLMTCPVRLSRPTTTIGEASNGHQVLHRLRTPI